MLPISPSRSLPPGSFLCTTYLHETTLVQHLTMTISLGFCLKLLVVVPHLLSRSECPATSNLQPLHCCPVHCEASRFAHAFGAYPVSGGITTGPGSVFIYRRRGNYHAAPCFLVTLFQQVAIPFDVFVSFVLSLLLLLTISSVAVGSCFFSISSIRSIDWHDTCRSGNCGHSSVAEFPGGP